VKEITITIDDFSKGLVMLPDEAIAPIGSARLMQNARISDRKGIAKRQGVTVIGDADTSNAAVTGIFRFKRADGTETLVKARSTEHLYLNNATWSKLEGSLTSGSRFGYASHIVNTDYRDYLYWGNRTEAYRRWNGAYTTTTAILAGGETAVPVTTVLLDDVFDSKTASASSTTTLDIATAAWATSQWVGFYVKITNGAKSGYISKISANTTTQITFAAISGLSGTPTFEVRRPLFDDTGTIVVAGTDVAYTAMPTATSFTVASAPAAASGSAVTQKPTAYVSAPYGNRLTNCLTRMYVGNVRSAIGYDSSGNKEGKASNRAVMVSKRNDATDFSFDSPRAADEGEIISFAYGGGTVNDVVASEDAVWALTSESVSLISYVEALDPSTGVKTELTTVKPLKPGIGNVGRAVTGKDDVYFATPRKEITSIGRVKQMDTTPQSMNIGLPIKRLLDARDFTYFDGYEWRDRLHFTLRSSSEAAQNDRVIIYNRYTKSWEGDWLIAANAFTEWDGKLAAGSSITGDALKMYDGEADTYGGVDYPIVTRWRSNWMNATQSRMENQSVCGFHCEGYIRGNSKFEFSLMSDFFDVPFLSGTFNGYEKSYLDGVSVTASLGERPLGDGGMASVEPPDEDGLSRFRFTVWFPDVYLTHLSFGFIMSQANEYVEINKAGFTLYADPLTVTPSRVRT